MSVFTNNSFINLHNNHTHIYENIGHVLPVILSLYYEHKVSTHYIKYIITMYYY